MTEADRQALRDNRLRWDDLVPLHVASPHYDLRGFLGGACTLTPIETSELADLTPLTGKRLLHTQCHFGLDTLSWARRGAQVTGVDFSPAAIDAARKIAARVGLPARFVEAEVTALGEALPGEAFDIVFTSWGVLGWLPDLDAWSRALVGALAPGGVLYLVEVHPMVWLYDPQQETTEGSRGRTFDYFAAGRHTVEAGGSYAVPDRAVPHGQEHFWTYTLGQVVTALLGAGRALEYLHEHDAVYPQLLPELIRCDDGLWRLPPGVRNLPLSFSLRGRKRPSAARVQPLAFGRTAPARSDRRRSR